MVTSICMYVSKLNEIKKCLYYKGEARNLECSLPSYLEVTFYFQKISILEYVR